MTAEELREEISIELDSLEMTLRELASLKTDAASREPSVREKTAAAAFLSQFYGGIENILKRISLFEGVLLPSGDMWHIELFGRFCSPSLNPLPALFDQSLATALAAYRKFRHVVHHGYGFQLEWDRMREGIEQIEGVFAQFKTALLTYLNRIK